MKCKRFKLKIEPAIDVSHRHKLGDFLKKLGYRITGSGQMVDDSSCDISFYIEEEAE